MGKNSGIEWTDHTFNPWWGCVKVSAGCDNCYAETWAKRIGGSFWGPDQPRRFFKPGHFNDPVRWNRKAEEAGRYDRVMCGSMCDIFEIHPDTPTAVIMNTYRDKLWKLIDLTPNLIWILVTKRPGNWRDLTPMDWYGGWPANVWAMATMENQSEAIRRMAAVETIPAVRAVSAEPLLGPIDPRIFRCGQCAGSGLVSTGRVAQSTAPCGTCRGRGISIDWIVAGGETGRKARPMDPVWPWDLRSFAEAYEVPFFFKQWGEWAPASPALIKNGLYIGETQTMQHEGSEEIMVRLGKKRTGKQLNGREWTQTPPMNPPRPYSDLPL